MWLLLQTKYTVRERKKCFEPKFKEFKMQAMNICLFGKKVCNVYGIYNKAKKRKKYLFHRHALIK